MSELYIPTKFRAALFELSKLTEEATSELCGLLEAHPEALTARDKAGEVANKASKTSAESATNILYAVIPLLFSKASSGRSTSTVVKDVVKALKAGENKNERLPVADIPNFERNLARFLDLSAVALRTKALSLATDCPRLFTEAKLIADIRPIFGNDVTAQPLGASIVHSLRISFSEEAEEKEFFVQLDAADLESLKDLVDRALKKDATLKAFLNSSDMQVFETS